MTDTVQVYLLSRPRSWEAPYGQSALFELPDAPLPEGVQRWIDQGKAVSYGAGILTNPDVKSLKAFAAVLKRSGLSVCAQSLNDAVAQGVPTRPYKAGVPNLYQEDGKLLIYGPYDAERVDAARRIRGRRWNGECDEVPLSSLDEVLKLMKPFRLKSWLPRTELGALREAAAAQAQANAERGDVFFETLPGRGRLIRFEFGYDPQRVDRLRESLNLSYAVTNEGQADEVRGWYAPRSEVLMAVRAAQLEGLSVGGDVLREAEALEAQEQQLAECAAEALALRDSGAAPCPEPAGLRATLLDYQCLPAALWPLTRKLLLADEQGLGKTVEAISVLLHARQEEGTLRGVIVCPSNLTENWRREFAAHTDGSLKVAVLETRTPGPIDADVCLIGWTVLGDWLDTLTAWEPTVMVADEGQLAKKGGGPYGSERGDAALRLAASVRASGGGVMVLTGTPLDARPLDVLALLEMLGEADTFGGHWGFKRRYCDPKSVKIRGGRTIVTYQGVSHSQELAALLHASPWYVRRTKRLLVERGQMQPKIVNGADWYDYQAEPTPLRVKLPHSAQVMYQTARKDFAQFLMTLIVQENPSLDPAREEDADALLSVLNRKMANILPKLGVLREITALGKLDAVTEHVRHLNQAGEQVMVIAHHRSAVDELAKRLCRGRILKIQGGMSAAKVEEVKAYFNSHGVDEAPNLILSMEAGKLGHTLCLQRVNAGLSEAAHVVIAEETFNPGTEAQAMDRIWRLPNTRAVTVTNVLAQDTIDEGIFSLRQAKRRASAAVIDGEQNLDADVDLSGWLSGWLHELVTEAEPETEMEDV